MRSFATLLCLLAACQDPDRSDRHPGSTTLSETGTSNTSTQPPTSLLRFDGAVPRNLLVLSVDTLRRDHLGTYGPHDYTPFLDQIALQSVVLEDHIQCANWTTASTTCTMTGSLNTDRGVDLLVGEPVPVVPNIAVWLRPAGFYSVFATDNLYFSDQRGVTVGFDRQQWVGGQNATLLAAAGLADLEDAMATGEVTDRWYLHLHFMEPHYPYNPEPEYLEGLPYVEPWPDDLTDLNVMRDIWPIAPLPDPEQQANLVANLQRLYAGDVRMTDDRLRQLWATLELSGMLDDTLVVFWTDHGDQFWEHGSQTHAYDLYGEENDAALWFWAKNLEPGRVDLPTASIDLVPTLLDLYGIEIPPEVTGTPIDQVAPERARFAHADAKTGPVFTVIEGGHKLMYWWNGRLELYDRAEDPNETTPLPLDGPTAQDLWCQLRPRIDEWSTVHLASPPTWPAQMGPCPTSSTTP